MYLSKPSGNKKKNEQLPNEGLAHFPICAAHKPNNNESFFCKKYSEKIIYSKTEFENKILNT